MSQTRIYRDQHSRLRELAAAMLRLAETAPAAEHRTALAKLAGSVKMHLKGEDDSLYPRLLSHKDSDVRDKAAALKTSMGALAATFGGFYERWIKPGAIDADTRGYLAEMRGVIDALAKRMDLEDRELYDLADRTLAAA